MSPGGKSGRCVGLTTLLSLCADCIEIWKSQTPGTLRACPCLYRDYYILAYMYVCIYIYVYTYMYVYIYIYIHIHTHTHTPFCGSNCVVVRDAVYSGNTKYSVKLADYMISIKELVLITAQVFPKRR